MPTATVTKIVPDVRHDIVNVTPKMAKDYLGLNAKNRPVKSAKIIQYTRDMVNGRWAFTGEAIKFDELGNLVDGQNRLHALIEAKVSVRFLIVWGVDLRAQEVMDSGVPRSPRDALFLRGYETPTHLAAAVNAHSLWSNGHYRHCMTQTPGYVRPSNAEVVAYAEDNPGLVEAARFAGGMRKALPIASGAIATAFYEMAAIDADDTEEFFSRIVGLKTDGKGDPINTLLKRVTDMRERRERVWPSTSLFLLMRTWNAYRANEQLLKFQFGSEHRGWAQIPVPK